MFSRLSAATCQGRHGYVLTLVDLHSRFAFALGTHSHTSTTAALFLEHVLLVFPGTVEAVLSDNGSEFQETFDKDLEERGIRHCVTRLKSSKMNAHAERFNRTVQEEFVQFEQDFLFTDVPLFNENLLDWSELADFGEWFERCLVPLLRR